MKFIAKIAFGHRVFASILIFLTLCCSVIGFAYLADVIDLAPWLAFGVGGFICVMALMFFAVALAYFFDNEQEEDDATGESSEVE